MIVDSEQQYQSISKSRSWKTPMEGGMQATSRVLDSMQLCGESSGGGTCTSTLLSSAGAVGSALQWQE